jgi:hypothetical protein
LSRKDIINTVELQFDVEVSGGRRKWLTVAFHPTYEYFREEPPVYRRAWCLQERELSRRTIQFTARGFIWDCSSMTMAERTLYQDFGNPISAVSNIKILNNHARLDLKYRRSNLWMRVGAVRSDMSLQPKPADKATRMEQHYDQWYHTMEVFSNAAIMIPEDRHAAIQALISQHAGRIADDCIHGLWSGDLERGLLWSVFEAKDIVKQPPVPEIAPSWSWMHLNGPVRFDSGIEASRRGRRDVSYSEFLDGITISILPWKQTRGRYDATYFPILHAQGRLVKLFCTSSGKLRREYHELKDVDDSVEYIDEKWIGSLRFDTQIYSRTFNSIVAFPMVDGRIMLEGLALVPVEMEAAEGNMSYYRRVGLLSYLRKDIVDGLEPVKLMIV